MPNKSEKRRKSKKNKTEKRRTGKRRMQRGGWSFFGSGSSEEKKEGEPTPLVTGSPPEEKEKGVFSGITRGFNNLFGKKETPESTDLTKTLESTDLTKTPESTGNTGTKGGKHNRYKKEGIVGGKRKNKQQKKQQKK
jgi:hypothetical protein